MTERQIEKSEANIWGSHAPVLRAACEVLQCRKILEFGVGKYSTPILVKAATDYFGVEHEWAWFAQIAASLHPRLGQRLATIVEPLPYGNLGEYQLTPEQREMTRAMFGPSGAMADFVRRHQPYDLMFIDGISATRNAVCATDLPSLAKAVVMHDTEAWQCYGWDVLRARYPDWQWFHFEMPVGMPCTDIAFSQPIDQSTIDRLRVMIDRESITQFGTSRPFTEKPKCEQPS